MAQGRAQQRRVKKLRKVQEEISKNLLQQRGVGSEAFLSSIAQPFSQLQQLGESLRTQSLSPFTQTAQGMGFLNAIEDQSQQAQENLADASSLLGLSDESYLSGTQNIAESEQRRVQSLLDAGMQFNQQARQGYGNILQNILGTQAQGFDRGLNFAQFGFGQGRGIQQQAGQMTSGIANTLITGASRVGSALATGGATGVSPS